MSSVNNAAYSFRHEGVHGALDKDGNGHVSQDEIKAYQQRLASNNTSAAKKAKSLLRSLLDNFDKVSRLHNSTHRGMPPRDAEDQQRRHEEAKQDDLMGLSLSDFSFLAAGSGASKRLEKLDFSTAQPWGGGGPPP